MNIKLHPAYSLLTLVYMGGIYWLSSLTGSEATRIVGWFWTPDLLHIPLYAGLAFCVSRAISTGKEGSWKLDGLAFLGAGAYGALDEWHQSFVAGRSAAVDDILLDLAGIGGMLLILRLRTFKEVRS